MADKDSEFTTDTIAKYLIELKCAIKTANLLNMSIGAIYEHKGRYEQKHGIKIQCESRRSQRIKELSEERRVRSLLPRNNSSGN
jgi:transposase